MSVTVTLTNAAESLDALGDMPLELRALLGPHVEQAKEILDLALENAVDEVGCQETALVAHTCVLSGVARAKGELRKRGVQMDPHAAAWVANVDRLLNRYM